MERNSSVLYIIVIGTILIVIMGGLFIGYLILPDDQDNYESPPTA